MAECNPIMEVKGIKEVGNRVTNTKIIIMEVIKIINLVEIVIINSKITQISTVSKIIITNKIKTRGEETEINSNLMVISHGKIKIHKDTIEIKTKGRILINSTIRTGFKVKVKVRETEDMVDKDSTEISKDSFMGIRDKGDMAIIILNMVINNSIISQWEEVDILSKIVLVSINSLTINQTNKITHKTMDKETITTNSKIITIKTDSMIKAKGIHVDNNMIISIISKVKDRITITLVRDMIKETHMTEVKGIQIKDREILAEIITEEGMGIIKDSFIMISETINLYKKTFLHLNLFLLSLIQR